jgi:hypothetical protein
MARGAGYPRAFAYGALEKLSRDVAGILDQPGPVFVALKVALEVETSPRRPAPALADAEPGAGHRRSARDPGNRQVNGSGAALIEATPRNGSLRARRPPAFTPPRLASAAWPPG